jgi:membrane fusion protein, multidrug efflux system
MDFFSFDSSRRATGTGRAGSMKTRTKRVLISIGGLLLVVGVLAGIKVSQIRSMIAAGETFAPPSESVTSAVVQESEWQPALTSVGTAVAMRAVTIAPELPGTVRRIAFESGQLVRANDVLVELDTSIEQAQLAASNAEAAAAATNYERFAALRKTKTVPQANYEQAETRAKQAEASLQNVRAMIAKKRIRAPFEGRLGMRSVDVGQVLAPGTPIVTLTDFDPIYVDFFLPQQALSQLAVDQSVRIQTDAFPNETWEGKISAIDANVDVATRNVKVRAQFQNENEKLRPGLFVTVQVVLPEKKKVLLVPATAIIHAPYGDSVFVIEGEKEKLIARQRFVRVGEHRGDLVAIESGLKSGETIVSAGAFKLRNGAGVVVNNELAPDAKIDPNPSDS